MRNLGRAFLLVAALAIVAHQPGLASGEPVCGSVRANRPARLVADFETRHGVALSVAGVQAHAPDVVRTMVEALSASGRLVLIVANQEEAAWVRELLAAHSTSLANVRIVGLARDTTWLRDYAPLSLDEAGRGAVCLGFELPHRERVRDRAAAVHLAELFDCDLRPLAIVAEGGNLLTNGQGLLIATERLLAENARRGISEPQVRRRLAERAGCRELVVLEPLRGEPTGHIDMWALFVQTDVLLVGAYRQDEDGENSAVLDRNAERLARVRLVDGRSLRVVRLPMPPHTGGRWRTYANVVFAGGCVLVPRFGDVERAGEDEALDVLGRWLPDKRLVSVESSELAWLEGGLRCLSWPLPRDSRLPASTSDDLLPRADAPEGAMQIGQGAGEPDWWLGDGLPIEFGPEAAGPGRFRRLQEQLRKTRP